MNSAVKWRSGRVIILATAVLVVLTGAFTAQTWAGGDEEEFLIQHSEMKYFRFPAGARVVGMGGAFTAIGGDPSSVYGNPAGLGTINQLHLRFNYVFDEISGHLPTGQPSPPNRPGIEEDIHGPSALLAVPNPWCPMGGTFGLGFNNYWYDVDGPGDTDGHGQTYMAAYGLPLSEQFFVGYGFGFYQQEQDRETNVLFNQIGGSDEGRLYSHRLGLLFRPINPVLVGTVLTYGYGDSERSLHDGGPGFDADHQYYNIRVGASWQMLEKTLLASDMEYSHTVIDSYRYIPNAVNLGEEGDAFGLHLGVEQGVTDWLCLRAGYRYHIDEYDFNGAPDMNDRISYNAFSAGAGLDFDWLNLDYALEYRNIGDGDWSNVLSTGFKF